MLKIVSYGFNGGRGEYKTTESIWPPADSSQLIGLQLGYSSPMPHLRWVAPTHHGLALSDTKSATTFPINQSMVYTGGGGYHPASRSNCPRWFVFVPPPSSPIVQNVIVPRSGCVAGRRRSSSVAASITSTSPLCASPQIAAPPTPDRSSHIAAPRSPGRTAATPAYSAPASASSESSTQFRSPPGGTQSCAHSTSSPATSPPARAASAPAVPEPPQASRRITASGSRPPTNFAYGFSSIPTKYHAPSFVIPEGNLLLLPRFPSLPACRETHVIALQPPTLGPHRKPEPQCRRRTRTMQFQTLRQAVPGSSTLRFLISSPATAPSAPPRSPSSIRSRQKTSWCSPAPRPAPPNGTSPTPLVLRNLRPARLSPRLPTSTQTSTGSSTPTTTPSATCPPSRSAPASPARRSPTSSPTAPTSTPPSPACSKPPSSPPTRSPPPHRPRPGARAAAPGTHRH